MCKRIEETAAPFPMAQRHRVLYLIDRLHSTAGGAEGIVHKLCRFLPAHGFDCSVATFWAGEDVAAEFPCEVTVLPMAKPYLWSATQRAVAFSGLLRSERVEILHTFFRVSDVWGGIVARLSGCPILISSRRDMGILRSKKDRVQYSFANPLFTQVQAVCERVREYCIREDRLSPKKVVTVPNGIDLDAVDAQPAIDRNAAFGVDDGTRVVITIANARPVKGIDVLIRAAAVVRKQLPDVIFPIIGETHGPEYLEELLGLAQQLGVGRNIRFLGRRSDVYSLLKSCDLFCLPSRSEGMSNALLEAMACRLPCVVTAVGGNPEVVVESQTGFLVPPENPQALAERILALLRHPGRAKQMGEEGRRVVESKFTVQHMVQRLGFLYNQLLEQRGLKVSERYQAVSTKTHKDRECA
jgi:L-malate glycosyltransferase